MPSRPPRQDFPPPVDPSLFSSTPSTSPPDPYRTVRKDDTVPYERPSGVPRNRDDELLRVGDLKPQPPSSNTKSNADNAAESSLSQNRRKDNVNTSTPTKPAEPTKPSIPTTEPVVLSYSATLEAGTEPQPHGPSVPVPVEGKGEAGSHIPDSGCDNCRRLKLEECNATSIKSCTACTNHGTKCQFTMDTHRGVMTITPAQDLEQQLAAAQLKIEQLQSAIDKHPMKESSQIPAGRQSGRRYLHDKLRDEGGLRMASTASGSSIPSTRKHPRKLQSDSSRRERSPASSDSTAASSIYENIDHVGEANLKYDISSWSRRIGDEPPFLDQGVLRTLSLTQIDMSIKNLQVARPIRQIDDLTERCHVLLRNIVQSLSDLPSTDPMAVDVVMWKEEHARLNLWKRDWEALVLETWDAFVANSQTESLASLLADIEDLQENLGEVLEISSGGKAPLLGSSAQDNFVPQSGASAQSSFTPEPSDDECADEVQDRLQMAHDNISGLYRRNKMHHQQARSILEQNHPGNQRPVQEFNHISVREGKKKAAVVNTSLMREANPSAIDKLDLRSHRSGIGRTDASDAQLSDPQVDRELLWKTPLHDPTSISNPEADRFEMIQHTPRERAYGRLPQPFKPAIADAGGDIIVHPYIPHSSVTTRFQTAPAQGITDPELFRPGISARRELLEQEQQLFGSFRIYKKPRAFFRMGKVLTVLWIEPAGESRTQTTIIDSSVGRFGEMVHSKIRRFVVIREGSSYCTALPLASYNGLGVSKHGVTKSEHGIIYTGKTAPAPLATELPARGEIGMRSQPIRVYPDSPQERLDPTTRIDYAKVHTIQHNIKVRSFGMVNPRSMAALLQQFHNVFAAPVSTTRSAGTPPSSSHSWGSNVLHELRPTGGGIKSSALDSAVVDRYISEDGESDASSDMDTTCGQ